MPEIVLKDWYGKEQTFDRDVVFAANPQGELEPFTHGVVKPLEITENGTFEAPEGVAGYSPVTVDIDPTVQALLPYGEVGGFALDSFFHAYTPGFVSPAPFILESGKAYRVKWDGEVFDDCVAYTIPAEEAITAIGNGSSLGLQGNDEPFLILHNATNDNIQIFSTEDDSSHFVGIWQKLAQEIRLQEKTITENGEYTADSGFDGLGKVTVEVAGSGGGSLPAGVYLSKSPIDPPNKYTQKRFMYNGNLYLAGRTDTSAGPWMAIHRWDDSTNAWVTVISTTSSTSGINNTSIDVFDFRTAEYNGLLHVFSGKYHAIFDGTTVTKSTDAPASSAWPVIYQGKLMVQCTNNKILSEWDESSATWVTVATFSSYYNYPIVVNGELYLYSLYKLYKYKDGELSEAGSVSKIPQKSVVVNGKLYTFGTGPSCYTPILEYDFVTNTEKEVGRIPAFSEVYLSEGTNDISFYATTTNIYQSSSTDRYPFFVLHIIEETE